MSEPLQSGDRAMLDLLASQADSMIKEIESYGMMDLPDAPLPPRRWRRLGFDTDSIAALIMALAVLVLASTFPLIVLMEWLGH